MVTSHLTRRSLLSAAVAAPLAAVLAVASAEPHPDAELLAAWEQYCIIANFLRAQVKVLSAEASAPYEERMSELRDFIENAPALTMSGALIKMRYLFISWTEAGWAENHFVSGAAPDLEDLKLDYRWQLHWNLIKDMERMGSFVPSPATHL